MLPNGGRQYKSRKARPCDICRGKKVACRMENGPPCQLCIEKQASCTFVQAPGKRKRPGTDVVDSVAREIGPDQSENDGLLETLNTPEWLADVIPSLASDGERATPYDELHPRPRRPRTSNSDVIISQPPLYHNQSFAVGTPPSQDYVSPGTDSQASQIHPASLGSGFSSHTYRNIEGRRTQIYDAGSLEAMPGVSYRAVGYTGDLDLYVLSYRSYDDNDESSVQYRGLRYRRMPPDPILSTLDTPAPIQDGPQIPIPPQVFTVLNDELSSQTGPRLDREVIQKAKLDLENLISPKLGYRLALLYARFVHPSFPILASRQFPSKPSRVFSMPPSLLAAVCATAIPFIIYDDILSVQLPDFPSEHDLFRLAWTLITEELHAPHLSTIQTCLLLLQRHDNNRYVPSTPFRPALISTTVSLCHCLSLHRDSSRWTLLPRWERQLRKRIWWAIWAMEKWTSLGESIPSVLKDDDFDVEPLTSEDMDDPIPQLLDSPEPSNHFPHLISLTVILSEVLNTFFTVRASARTTTNLELSLESAKPLRVKLKQWHDSLPPDIKSQILSLVGDGPRRSNLSSCSLNPSGSFYLSYLTVQMTLLRALLRPVSSLASFSESTRATNDSDEDGSTGLPMSAEQKQAIKAVVKGAMTCVKDVVRFVENLTGSEWDSFWHGWSRTNMAIVGGVMLNLLVILRPPVWRSQICISVQTPSGQADQRQNMNNRQHEVNTKSFLDLHDDYRMLLDHLTRWRWVLKISSRGAGGQKGLMNLSLLRMDALLSELSNVSPMEMAEDED